MKTRCWNSNGSGSAGDSQSTPFWRMIVIQGGNLLFARGRSGVDGVCEACFIEGAVLCCGDDCGLVCRVLQC